jgi:hypothetical protein
VLVIQELPKQPEPFSGSIQHPSDVLTSVAVGSASQSHAMDATDIHRLNHSEIGLAVVALHRSWKL